MNIHYLAPRTLALLKTISPQPTVVLGLSGGPDSVFLFYLLKELHYRGHLRLVATHLNHEWRAEALHDEIFCKDLCALHNIPFVSTTANALEISIKPNGSQEEIGRKLRRFFLEKIMKEQQADAIALAHHFDDQQETFFMRLIRGTSLSGLHGMNEIEHPYIRPLLQVKKQEIVTWLQERNLKYVIDHTNESDNYLRNRIRKYVIPALQSCDTRFDTNFQSTVEKLKAEDAFLSKLTQVKFQEIFSKNHEGTLMGSLIAFKQQDTVLQKRIILAWLIAERVSFATSSGFIEEIIKFLSSNRGGKHAITPQTMVYKKHGSFFFSKSSS